MTKLKIQGAPGSAAKDALEPHLARIYGRPGIRVMAIVELAHVERTQPAPDSDKDASVTMRISHLEVPNDQQEGAVREAQRALFLHRTAHGTLDDAGHLELSQDTVRLTGGMLHAVEVARLRAGLAHWVKYMRRVVDGPDLTLSEVRHELDTIADGLDATLTGAGE